MPIDFKPDVGVPFACHATVDSSGRECKWETERPRSSLAKPSGRASKFTAKSEHSGLYTSADLSGWDIHRSLGFPGESPYTRAIYDLGFGIGADQREDARGAVDQVFQWHFGRRKAPIESALSVGLHRTGNGRQPVGGTWRSGHTLSSSAGGFD
jgi:hypothetical protein